MIDLKIETPIPLQKIRSHRLLSHKGRNGRPVAFSTLWKWARHGLGGVKLETVNIGQSMATTPEALARFLRAPRNLGSRDAGGDARHSDPGGRRARAGEGAAEGVRRAAAHARAKALWGVRGGRPTRASDSAGEGRKSTAGPPARAATAHGKVKERPK